MIEQLFYSLTHRWYVTLFMMAFVGLSYLEQGGKRTAIWLVSGYVIAWFAEWLSINYGLPFGWYVYHDDVLAKDLTIARVPVFDSISFAFLSYVSFSFAQYFFSPLLREGGDVQRVTSRRLRNSAGVLFLGAALMVVIDIVVDPVAHLGKHWFLGDIYHYLSPGVHFDVPLTNYAGWFIVGWAIIFLNQRVDAALAQRELAGDKPAKTRNLKLQGLYAPLFWTGIVVFQLGVTYAVAWGDDLSLETAERVRLQFLTGLFMVTPILLLTLVLLLKPSNRASREMITSWLAEYPNPKFEQRN